MRNFLTSRFGRWLSASWAAPLILLALPACGLQTEGLPNPNAFDGGTGDLSSAVMCDIPAPQDDGNPTDCATSTDIGAGMPFGHAAVALGDGSGNTMAIDFTPDPTGTCTGPRKTQFFDPFPKGTTVCLNCIQQIPLKFSGPQAVCIAKCKELVSAKFGTPKGGLDDYCTKNARVSTNFAGNICFNNACSMGGTPLPNFVDPRVTAEPVKWTPSDLNGVSAAGNSVTRTAATTGGSNSDFNAGAASEQLVISGDAWVEFEASENTLSHVIGFRESCADISNCADTDPGLSGIGFAIILNVDGQVYALEGNGTVNPTVLGPFGTYSVGERFRVHVTDNHDGTAAIAYTRSPCTAGMPCVETPLAQHAGPGPKYPLRIDATFREQGATSANVTVMRIVSQ